MTIGSSLVIFDVEGTLVDSCVLCVPKTSSALIARPNRLNVSGDDRALLAPPGPVRLTVQVKERTCGRERCAPTSN